MWLLFLALTFAVLNSLGLWNGWKWLQYIAKPAVMVVLFIYLWTSIGLSGTAFWFALGILFSLVGDVLLLFIDRYFIFGLISFLLGHIAYITGFNLPPSPLSLWGLVIALVVGLNSARLVRRLLAAVVEKGQLGMRLPLALYGLVLSLMLFSAMLKTTDLAWDAGAAAMVGLGALLFAAADVILAWNKFVTPIKNGRLINVAIYHLGQIFLIAGVVLQYQ